MKHKIPLEILETFQPLTDGNRDFIYAVRNSAVLWHVKDDNTDSDFFFKIIRNEASNTKHGYIIEFYPQSRTNVVIHKIWATLEQSVEYYKNWIEILKSYNKVHTVYDDPILKANQERFEKLFEILDDDADTASFNLEQQFFLTEYLGTANNKIESFKTDKDSDEQERLNELQDDVAAIQRNLTTEPKRKIIRRLSKLWGKAQMLGLDIIKEIFVNVAAELTKKLLTGQ